MKKVLLVLAGLAMTMAAGAQVVTSRTMVKAKSQTMWYARVGMSIDNLTGIPSDEYTDSYGGYSVTEKNSGGSKVGMDIDFGFHRNIGRSGLYWGMELGIGTRGASFKYEFDETYTDGERYSESEKTSLSAWNIKYSPFTFGYKYGITNDIKLDVHLGAFISYDFTKKWKDVDGDDMFDYFDYQSFDAGMQVGVGVWYKKFNLDLTYQRGFVTAFDGYNQNTGEDFSAKSSNFMIRLGYAF